MSELTSLTIAQLRDGFRSREFSARQIAEAFNAAVAAAKSLNAYTVETPEDALARPRGLPTSEKNVRFSVADGCGVV